jgi:hypothetical protein
MKINSIILLVTILSSSTAISSNFITATPAIETGSNHIRSRSLLDEDINDAVDFEIARISSSDGQQEREEEEEPQGRRSLALVGGSDVNSNGDPNPNIGSGNTVCTKFQPCGSSQTPFPSDKDIVIPATPSPTTLPPTTTPTFGGGSPTNAPTKSPIVSASSGANQINNSVYNDTIVAASVADDTAVTAVTANPLPSSNSSGVVNNDIMHAGYFAFVLIGCMMI